MKVAVSCQSLLLQKSLEIFLGDYLCTNKKGDIVITDKPCLNDSRCFYISTSNDADLQKPFSKSQLLVALQKRYALLNSKKEITEIEDIEVKTQEEDIKISDDDKELDFSLLESRIEMLTDEYKKNILTLIKAFYEK